MSTSAGKPICIPGQFNVILVQEGEAILYKDCLLDQAAKLLLAQEEMLCTENIFSNCTRNTSIVVPGVSRCEPVFKPL